ncbi:VOC family protein [Enemella evansiae]|uniref:Biphenyl 2,3-dioxygenase n=1 Tax=Enemella evansiae TaxID=2016499 RepID=A0A255GNL1_9ACTN|nr:VOC family protein [Enemella evansiae]PFG69249.1 glyoxalase/bleomycin resistance protein/dioxygenase superfamily protein [Propionibacteriaceae bacterium ES.041]OYO00876.1 biphenyl 2,3-dioxygenase [Enemella evansiae]OYO02501.1 biphenyl 2,3-dioxygenase [Enemella evansiae]OYO02997.1 biphenyl 2,3-dioxygenase [Enemella evansiae]OYO12146.1 biphenyl 2,3-dioxygenase [Enemella evansiae]
MAATPKFAHVVLQTGQPDAMRDWYTGVLDGKVVFADDTLTFIAYDEEHHRVALLHPPIDMQKKTPTTSGMHHVAYTFDSIDTLLDRYQLLRDRGIEPAVCVNHGITTSLYYRDPDRNFVELQIDVLEPEAATEYLNGPDYQEDSIGPAFDPQEMLAARRGGASVDELTARSWAKKFDLPPAIHVMMGE